MSRQCEICGKKSLKACKLSFSHKHHIYRQNPNLQSLKVNCNGSVKTIKACTSCIKANKVVRAV
jgi:large subunit ribosomal protein L28